MARQKVVGGASYHRQNLFNRLHQHESAVPDEWWRWIETKDLSRQQRFEADQRSGREEEMLVSPHGHKIENKKPQLLNVCL